MPNFQSIIKAYDLNNNEDTVIDGGHNIVQKTGYELYNDVCQALREGGFGEDRVSKVSKVLVCYENLDHNVPNSPTTA